MHPFHLIKEFHFFGLPVTESLEALDERYSELSMELEQQKREQTEESYKTQQEEIDRNYTALLKHFIKVQSPRRRREVSFDDLQRHREGRSPSRRPRRSSTVSSEHQQPAPVVHQVQATEVTAMEPAGADQADGANQGIANQGVANQGAVNQGAVNQGAVNQGAVNQGVANPDNESSQADEVTEAEMLEEIVEQEPEAWDWHINYSNGDIFQSVPDQGVIVHATNCMGVWGKGFARDLKTAFPGAYRFYRHYCNIRQFKDEIAGSCLLIHPQPEDFEVPQGETPKPRTYIACLFTSVGYGKQRGQNPGLADADFIIANSDSALVELRDQLDQISESAEGTAGTLSPGNIHSPRFNSGLFDVVWTETSRLIELSFQSGSRSWTVYSLPEAQQILPMPPVWSAESAGEASTSGGQTETSDGSVVEAEDDDQVERADGIDKQEEDQE